MQTSRWIILRNDANLGLRIVDTFDVEFDEMPGLSKALNLPSGLTGPFYALVIRSDQRVELRQVHKNPHHNLIQQA